VNKISLKPFKPYLIGAAVLVLMAGSFFAGDILHGYVPNPFVSSSRINFNELNDLYSMMKSNFDGKLTPAAALDGARKGLVAAGGDPYTVYMDSTQAKALSDDLNGQFSGIGAEIGIKNNVLTVISPIAGTPAEKSGLRAGDLIAKINGEDTTDMSVDLAVSKIRGPKDTQVTLRIVRTGSDPQNITITRDNITVPSVNWEIKNGNVGYIKLSRFGSDTADLVNQAASELKAKGATKVILDLRNNGGGYLDAGVSVASQFLPAGQLVVEERTNGKSVNKLDSTDGGLLVGLPTIVLINEGSASASEIVAGALHDNGAARLVGVTSFGKGSVQEIKTLPGGAQLKVTVAHWYTPKGVNINKEGIKPDVEVKLTTDDYNANRDPQMGKALELLK
jgi:carboxyl-terminal processing protease